MAHHVHAIGIHGQLRLQCGEHRVVERDVAVAGLARLCLPARLYALRIGDAFVAHDTVGVHDDRRGPESFDVQLALDALAAAAVSVEHEDEWCGLRCGGRHHDNRRAGGAGDRERHDMAAGGVVAARNGRGHRCRGRWRCAHGSLGRRAGREGADRQRGGSGPSDEASSHTPIVVCPRGPQITRSSGECEDRDPLRRLRGRGDDLVEDRLVGHRRRLDTRKLRTCANALAMYRPRSPECDTPRWS